MPSHSLPVLLVFHSPNMQFRIHGSLAVTYRQISGALAQDKSYYSSETLACWPSCTYLMSVPSIHSGSHSPLGSPLPMLSSESAWKHNLSFIMRPILFVLLLLCMKLQCFMLSKARKKLSIYFIQFSSCLWWENKSNIQLTVTATCKISMLIIFN